MPFELSWALGYEGTREVLGSPTPSFGSVSLKRLKDVHLLECAVGYYDKELYQCSSLGRVERGQR